MSVVGRNFCFVHVYRTGGTSLTSVLKECGGKLVPPWHPPAWYVKEKIVEKWDDVFSFGFVRNPYSWMVSLYEYIKNTGHIHNAIVRKMSYLEFLHFAREKVLEQKYYTLTEALCDKNGVPLVNFVGRFENLQRDACLILKKIGVHRENIPRLNSGRRKAGPGLYYRNPRAVDLILETFDRDFLVFGYDSTPPV